MEESHRVEEKRKTCPPRGAARRGRQSYPVELRLKLVKLRLEEGYPLELLCRESRVSQSALSKWILSYQQHGEAGLQPLIGGRKAGVPKVAAAVKAQITTLKRQNPHFGVKRIAQLLRRVLFLPGSAETVRRTLHQEQLIHPRKKKPQRNPPKPRFFERATPNQMWQTDIFTFRLGGKNAYLIGFIDDHSRYIVGLDLFRSQMAEHVLEVYRTAVGEYGVPKEMLTDNGRQYTAWHGKTRFEHELAKDRVHHFRSQPHHPMTLGKIERFWKTIWENFLERAQFDSFEQARERVRLWVKYYNHKRPHQSLDGLFPADRFFAIAKELRAVIERGIADNVQELALRGQPQEPFYMVGRLGQQSVVLRAEKGQIKMQIDGEDEPQNQLSYQLNQPTGEQPHDERNQTQEGTESVQRPPASAGGAGGVDRAAAPGGSLSADGHQQHVVDSVAATGDGRDAGSSAASLPSRSPIGPGVDGQVGTAVGAPGVDGGRQTGQTGQTTGQVTDGAGPGHDVGKGEMTPGQAKPETVNHDTDTESLRDAGAATSGVDCPGTVRPDHGDRGGDATGGEPQDLLRMGETSVECAGDGAGGPAGGSPVEPARSREGHVAGTETGPAGATPGVGADAGDPPTNNGTAEFQKKVLTP